MPTQIKRSDGPTQDYHTRVELKEATKKDIPFIVDTINKYSVLPSKFEKEDLKERKSKHFIVYHQDQKIGVVGISIHQKWLVLIKHLIILPDFRRQKFGTDVMKRMFQYVDVKGYGKISLTVNSLNRGAINLYEKLGFEREGVLRSHYGSGRTIFVYSKILKGGKVKRCRQKSS